MKLMCASYDLSPEDLAEFEEELAEERRRQEEYDKMVRVLWPLVARAFPGGWRYGNRRFVGDFSIEEFWPENSDEPNLKGLRVSCPDCTRKFAPFQSRSVIGLNGGWRWVGLDHQEPYTEYFAACGWCGGPMLFIVYLPQ